ncbi:MAG: hypothetical protein ACK526_06370 [Planctomyces sp.]
MKHHESGLPLLSRRNALKNALSVGIATGLARFGSTASAFQPSIFAAISGAGVPQEPLVLNHEPMLFLDHRFIARSENLRLKLHPPKETGERLLESEHPWENATLNWFTVLNDGGRYRMWYECYDVEGWPTADDTSFCYAESTDGVHWIKPELGLYEYRGSRKNNILFRQIGEGNFRSRVHGSCVFLNPKGPPEHRYLCVSQGLFQGIGDRPYYIAGMSSPDGIHWTRLPKPICHVFADSQYSGFYDSNRERYILYGRTGGRNGRAIGRSTSDHIEEFPPLELTLQADEQHPGDADLYNPACGPLPGHPGYFLMMPSLFRHGADTLDIHLAVSADGVHWTWPDSQTPFISLGDPGSFDGGSLYMANGGGVLTGNDISFYYSGSLLKHEEVELDKLSQPENRRVFTRAVCDRTRLVSLSAPETISSDEGWFETPDFQCDGPAMLNTPIELDADIAEGGHVQLEFMNRDGKVIRGRGRDDYRQKLVSRNRLQIQWQAPVETAEISDHQIRLRVHIRRASLFGIQFVKTD